MLRKKEILRTIIIVTILLVFFLIWISTFTLFHQYRARNKLLCKTNYKLLLEACRELPKPVQNPGRKYYSAKSIEKNPLRGFSSNDKKVIFSLNPTSVFVDETGLIVIDLGNPHWDLGIRAYPEDFNEPYFDYGDRELIQGLWYYDEQYNYDPNYSSKIEEMIQKNKYINEYEE